MVKIILALSILPVCHAKDTNEPYNLELFQQRRGFCAHLPQDKIPPVEESVAVTEKLYQDQLQEEACKFLLLKEAISATSPPPICAEVSAKGGSDCMAKAVEKIHLKEPLSPSGTALYSSIQIGFIMKERKESTKDIKSAQATKKIMALQIQMLKLIRSRAKPKDWQIKKESIETADHKVALSLCEKVKKIGSNMLKKDSDPKITASLSAEKKEFESLPACE